MLIVHVTLMGLSLSGIDYLRLSEQPRPQPPFVTAAPFSPVCLCSWATYEDWTATLIGTNQQDPMTPQYDWWSWWAGTLFVDPSEPVKVGVKTGTVVSMRAMSFGEFHEMREVFAWKFDPCDLNMDGRRNINDFTVFVANPYDWNGDGSIDVLDYTGLLEMWQH